jgi:hypothetical protein
MTALRHRSTVENARESPSAGCRGRKHGFAVPPDGSPRPFPARLLVASGKAGTL